jgi:hypothetical protein
MGPMTSRQLAWELADQLGQHLSEGERIAVFVDLGSGEDVAAVHRLIRIAARCGHSLPIRTAKQFSLWAHAQNVQDQYAPILSRIEAAFSKDVEPPRV